MTIPSHYCESITLYPLAVIEEKIQETLERVCSSTAGIFSPPYRGSSLGKVGCLPEGCGVTPNSGYFQCYGRKLRASIRQFDQKGKRQGRCPPRQPIRELTPRRFNPLTLCRPMSLPGCARRTGARQSMHYGGRKSLSNYDSWRQGLKPTIHSASARSGRLFHFSNPGFGCLPSANATVTIRPIGRGLDPFNT